MCQCPYQVCFAVRKTPSEAARSGLESSKDIVTSILLEQDDIDPAAGSSPRSPAVATMGSTSTWLAMLIRAGSIPRATSAKGSHLAQLISDQMKCIVGQKVGGVALARGGENVRLLSRSLPKQTRPNKREIRSHALQ